MLTRRNFLKAGTVLGVTALGACTKAEQQMIDATLENAETETSAIWSVVKAFVPATLTAPISIALGAAQTAVTAFLAIQPGKSGLQAAEAVVNKLEPLLALLPIPPITVETIDDGLTLVEAFANGIAQIAVPAPSAAVGAVPVRTIPAPIPILVPLS